MNKFNSWRLTEADSQHSEPILSDFSSHLIAELDKIFPSAGPLLKLKVKSVTDNYIKNLSQLLSVDNSLPTPTNMGR